MHLRDSRAGLANISETSWAFAKTGDVNTATKTVEWTITAIQGPTNTGKLMVDGYMEVDNDGFADATIGNIVINLQAQVAIQHHHHTTHQWATVSSDIADATQDDAATTAHVVADSNSDQVELFSENAASGHVVFMDATNNTVFSLVPEKTIPARTSVPLLFSASFDNNVLGLAVHDRVRAEVIVTFGNSDQRHSATDVDINGNGVIDADEDFVRSVSATHDTRVPAPTVVNATPTITDTTADFATTGTVTISNPSFNIGPTSGTVTVKYNAGTSGGAVTNCAHLDSPDTTTTIHGYTFNDFDGIHLTACNTETVKADSCQVGTPGCGWADGVMITYTQASWGGQPGVDAGASLLVNDYDSVYAPTFGIVTVGSTSGFTMRFTDAQSVLAYQPSIGPFGPLNGNVLNPITTAAGGLGGEVLALEFNVDFTADSALRGTLNVPYGTFHLCGLTGNQAVLNGTTIYNFLAVMNTLLGGGTSVLTIADLGSLVGDVNAAFSNGTPSTFAQQHVAMGACN